MVNGGKKKRPFFLSLLKQNVVKFITVFSLETHPYITCHLFRT